MTSPDLKRVLGLSEVTFIAVGFMIGGGVFVFTGIVLKLSGNALPLAYALAVVPVFIAMLPLAMLGSAMPVTGACYRYPSRMVSPGLAFVGIWVYALSTFCGQIPLYSLGCAGYVEIFLPGIPKPVFAALLVTGFFLVNLFGLRLAARIQGILVILLLAALLLYAAAGIARFDPMRLQDLADGGSAPVLIGTALLTFTYFGANGIIELGGEIVDPGRVIPRSFFIAFPIVTVIYVLVALATVNALPPELLRSEAEPLVRVARTRLGSVGFLFFITCGAVLALTTTLNALFIVGTKSLLMIVDDRLLPRSLGRLHPRYGTPHRLLTAIWLFSLAGLFAGLPLKTLAAYSALGGLIVFLPLQLAAVKLPGQYPERYRRAPFRLNGAWLWICPAVGGVMVLLFALLILFDLHSAASAAFFAAFVLSGAVYYLLRKRYLQSRGLFRIAPEFAPESSHEP